MMWCRVVRYENRQRAALQLLWHRCVSKQAKERDIAQ